jgi:ABC-type multidrug transport system fused ATPase/permease subunit
VYENLACGNRLLGRTEVEAAARTAGAHDFIMAMKDGYQTVVGVRGMKLSGGERARLSIARAILRNPSILIFDEATAFMDSVTERIFRDASETLFRDKTLIFIAHRLASICDTDNIMVFESGRVVQQGTHDELINLPGLYQRLYLEQSKPSHMGETMKASLSDAALRVED